MEKMRLSVGAAGAASAVTWSLAVFLVGLINMAKPGYGAAFLAMVSSIYPGYHAQPTLFSVLVGTAYALVDGAVCGVVFSWLYNRLLR